MPFFAACCSHPVSRLEVDVAQAFLLLASLAAHSFTSMKTSSESLPGPAAQSTPANLAGHRSEGCDPDYPNDLVEGG